MRDRSDLALQDRADLGHHQIEVSVIGIRRTMSEVDLIVVPGYVADQAGVVEHETVARCGDLPIGTRVREHTRTPIARVRVDVVEVPAAADGDAGPCTGR